jgi:type IV pilus assembly protein PilO
MAKKIDLSNLTLENLGSWPFPVKAGAVAILCAVILGAGYWYDTQPQQAAFAEAQKKETNLKQTFEAKQQQAANLKPLKRQLEAIKQTMGEMLQKLPSKTEVPDLLQSISQAGLGAGLEFETFKPGAEHPAEFYVELPITIKVDGDYHEFGKFVSAVASLERIVTIHDINIKTGNGPGGKLVMETTAKTYRYMDEAEEEAAAKNEKAKAKKR